MRESGTATQVDLNPSVFDKRFDATVEALIFIPNITDQYFLQGKEREESHVDVRSQTLSGSLGQALGSFFRIKETYDLEYANYSRDEDTDTFVVPSDTPIHSLGLSWEFNRRAWSITASARRSIRANWEPWGDTTAPTAPILAEYPLTSCDSPGSCLAEFDPDADTYDRYQLRISKQVFLPLFQKLSFEGAWFSGSNLDRFSEYRFSFFGPSRVRGFSGSGVRFDRGGIARAQYDFNLGEVVRFGASIDHARVRDSLTSDSFDSFTGFGVSGSLLVPPWRSILRFDVGVAVQSDFDELNGDTEFQVILLKFF